jgi:hypothetical protein
MTSLRRLDELRVDAHYHRERRDLYRAKMYGPRPASPAHMKELERDCALSESRLRRAKQELQASPALRFQLPLSARSSSAVAFAGLASQGDCLRF